MTPMTLEELLERLKSFEWDDMEFKKALFDVPKDAYKTVSAFSNTAGGWLIFGVEQKDRQNLIVGVIDVDKVQNDFLGTLRDPRKFSRVITAQADLLKHGDNNILTFYIPEVRRQDKPIYLDGNPWLAFIRRGARDEQCKQFEIEAFLRDASDMPYASQVVDELDAATFFDQTTVQWYRTLFYDGNSRPGREVSDLDFLHYFGYVTETQGLRPTRAGVLLFGTVQALHQILQRAVVDVQWVNANAADETAGRRWEDRLVSEENLLETWRNLAAKYTTWASKPFAIEATTLQRQDTPPDYVAFREAAINLLIHQDYGDQYRVAAICFFRDQTVLFNSGDSFADPRELLEPGSKPVRNSSIVDAFRRIGLSEHAGGGIGSIYQNWRELGRVPPVIQNSPADKAFTLCLPREELFSEAQILFEASLGAHLTDPQAATFAFACRQQQLDVRDVKAVTGLPTAQAWEILRHLETQSLLKRMDALPECYELAPHVRELLEPGGAAPAALLHALSEMQRKIIQVTDTPRSISFLTEWVGVKRSKRAAFIQAELQPLVNNHILQLTRPEQPDYRFQKYVLTPVGLKLKNRQRGPA